MGEEPRRGGAGTPPFTAGTITTTWKWAVPLGGLMGHAGLYLGPRAELLDRPVGIAMALVSKRRRGCADIRPWVMLNLERSRADPVE